MNETPSYAELLKAVERGKKVTICRYNKPVAELTPAKPQRKTPKFGTLKGKLKIIDPNWAVPMSDEEVDAFLEGRY